MSNAGPNTNPTRDDYSSLNSPAESAPLLVALWHMAEERNEGTKVTESLGPLI